MRYVNLGSTGIKVSVIGFGAWAIGGKWWGGNDEKDSLEAIAASIDEGVNFIDTAPAYGQGLSEELVGRVVAGKRDKIVIATKCGLRWDLQKGSFFFKYAPGNYVYRYLGAESIKFELEQSLKRLKTDYIDLYQTHWQDSTTPIEETMGALMELKQEGKIRAIGVSNASLKQIKEYAMFGKVDSDQEKYSIIDKEVERDLLPWCRKNKASLLAYSPMSRGLLTGKILPERKFGEDDSRTEEERFSPVNIEKTNLLLEKYLKVSAEKHNAAYGHLAVASIIRDPSVIALVGARNKAQAVDNVKSASIELDEEDLERISNFSDEYTKIAV